MGQISNFPLRLPFRVARWLVAPLLLSACGILPKFPHLPASKISLGAASVVSSGPVEKPAVVTTRETLTTIPPGYEIILKPSTVGHSNVLPVTVSEKTESVTSATNYQPPTPPTPSDTAKGEGIKMFYYLAAICAALAVLALYLQHYKAAGILILAAGGLPVLINMGETVAASHLAVAAICIATTLAASWYFLRNNASVKAEILAAESKISGVETKAQAQMSGAVAAVKTETGTAAAALDALIKHLASEAKAVPAEVAAEVKKIA